MQLYHFLVEHFKHFKHVNKHVEHNTLAIAIATLPLVDLSHILDLAGYRTFYRVTTSLSISLSFLSFWSFFVRMPRAQSVAVPLALALVGASGDIFIATTHFARFASDPNLKSKARSSRPSRNQRPRQASAPAPAKLN